MRSADGKEYPAHSVYVEVVENSRLVYKDDTEEVGEETPPVTINMVTFEDAEGGKTKLTIHSLVATVEDRNKMLEMGCNAGMNESLDRLEESLPVA